MDGSWVGAEFIAPAKALSFRNPTVKRVMSEEQRQIASERMKKIAQSRASSKNIEILKIALKRIIRRTIMTNLQFRIRFLTLELEIKAQHQHGVKFTVLICKRLKLNSGVRSKTYKYDLLNCD